MNGTKINTGALVKDRAGFYWRVVATTPSGRVFAMGPATTPSEPICGDTREFEGRDLVVVAPTADGLAVVIL